MQNINQFGSALSNYDKLQTSINDTAIENAERVSPNNPYLNKYIQFSNGTMCFVTNRGVAKPFNNNTDFTNIAGKGGCPKTTQVIKVDIEWTVDMIPGAIINTTPTLIVGTPMQPNTYCTHSGQNVFVTENISNPTSTYVGCYNSNTSDNNSMITDNETQCLLYATDNGYKFAAMKKMNDGTISCSTANNKEDMTKDGSAEIKYTPISIWNSGTSGSGNMMQISPEGQVKIVDTSGKTIWTSSNEADISCTNGGNISNVVATYGGNCNSNSKYAVESGNVSEKVNETITSLMDDNSKIFDYTIPISNTEFGDPAQGCNKSFDASYMCGNTPYVKHIDDAEGQSVILSCNAEVKLCDFYLILDNNGTMKLVKGNLSASSIWTADLSSPVQFKNDAFVAKNGKMGRNYLKTGESLFAGEWIASPSGNIRLVMQSDGNLVLYTYSEYAGCTQKNNKLFVGDSESAFAVYEHSTVGDKLNVGKVAYIDANLEKREYPASILSYTTNKSLPSSYTTFFNNDSRGNDISASKQNNVQECETACTDNKECGGFVWDTDTTTCYLKNISMYPKNSRQFREGTVMGIKNPSIKSNSNCNTKLTSIDSIQYSSYKSGKDMTSDSTCHAKFISKDDKTLLTESTDKLKDIGTRIASTINTNYKAQQSQISDVNKQQSKLDARLKKYNYSQNNKSNNRVINVEQFQNLTLDDLHGINENLELFATSENTMYMALGIISVGLIFVAYTLKIKTN